MPAGYSMQETVRIAERMEKAARPLWEGKTEKMDRQPLSVFSLLLTQVVPLQVHRVLILQSTRFTHGFDASNF